MLKYFILIWSFYSCDAGFRCSWFFVSTTGDSMCSTSCVVMGHKSGMCDAGGECRCSETYISWKDIRKLLPSRCTLGLSFCKGTCQAGGRVGGDCTKDHVSNQQILELERKRILERKQL